MSDVTQEQVVEYIKGISVIELSQLVEYLLISGFATIRPAHPIVRCYGRQYIARQHSA